MTAKSPYAEIDPQYGANGYASCFECGADIDNLVIDNKWLCIVHIQDTIDKLRAELQKRDEWIKKAGHLPGCAFLGSEGHVEQCTCKKDSLCGEGE